MAKLGGFLNVTDIRGKLGGTVFSKTRSAHILRTRIKGRNPRSSRQTVARDNMATSSREAKAMDAATVLLWKDYAASITKHNSVSGAAYHPSWITAYNELAIPFLGMTPGGTPPDTPPADPFTGDTITATIAGGVGKVTLTGSAEQGAGIMTAILVQKLPSANREPNPKGYVLDSWVTVPATPFQVDSTTLSPGFYAVGYKFGKVSTGQETLPVFLGVVEVS